MRLNGPNYYTIIAPCKGSQPVPVCLVADMWPSEPRAVGIGLGASDGDVRVVGGVRRELNWLNVEKACRRRIASAFARYLVMHMPLVAHTRACSQQPLRFPAVTSQRGVSLPHAWTLLDGAQPSRLCGVDRESNQVGPHLSG